MIFKIHFEHPDGTEDSFIVEADSLEGISEAAWVKLNKMGARPLYSEEL